MVVRTRRQRAEDEAARNREAMRIFMDDNEWPDHMDSGSSTRMESARRWTKRYRPSDWSRRHRLEDDQPKRQRVVSYVRRA